MVVTTQVALLTSDVMATSPASRTLLSSSMILELLGTLLAVYFLQYHRHPTLSNPMPKLAGLASGAPTTLISMGIFGLSVSLAVDSFNVSLGAAMAVTGTLVFGAAFCFFAAYSATSHFK